MPRRMQVARVVQRPSMAVATPVPLVGGGFVENTAHYVFTGGVQYFTVPRYVYSTANIDDFGKINCEVNGQKTSSHSGLVESELHVIPGETLGIYVGGKPGSTPETLHIGGWNGGGDGGYDPYHIGVSGYGPYTEGGGGASDIRRGATRLVVGGGAGGGGGFVGWGAGAGSDGTDRGHPYLTDTGLPFGQGYGGGSGGLGTGGPTNYPPGQVGGVGTLGQGGAGVDTVIPELVGSVHCAGSLGAAAMDSFGQYISGPVDRFYVSVPYLGSIVITDGYVVVADTQLDFAIRYTNSDSNPNASFGDNVEPSGFSDLTGVYSNGTHDINNVPQRWNNVGDTGRTDVYLWVYGGPSAFDYNFNLKVYTPPTAASSGGGGGYQGGGAGGGGAYAFPARPDGDPILPYPPDPTTSWAPYFGDASGGGGGGSSYVDLSVGTFAYYFDNGFWDAYVDFWWYEPTVTPTGTAIAGPQEIRVATPSFTQRVRY